MKVNRSSWASAFSPELSRVLEFRPESLQHPDAWVGHTPFAYWSVQHLEPEIFVELGTHSGNSFFSFCQSISENNLKTRAFAVDTWSGDVHAGFYDESVFEKVFLENQKYSNFSKLLRMTFDSAASEFEDGTINLLHIDGLHTYAAVKHDFETWLPKMAPGGFIFFHDTNVFADDFGVHLLWSELSRNYSTLEFKHCNGLGILQVSPGPRTLIPIEEDEKASMVSFFSGLSAYALTAYRESVLKEALAEIQQHVTALSLDRDSHLAAYNALIRSWSWRVTAPLRWLLRVTNRT